MTCSLICCNASGRRRYDRAGTVAPKEKPRCCNHARILIACAPAVAPQALQRGAASVAAAQTTSAAIMRKAPRAIALVLGLVLLLQPAAGQWPGAPSWRFGGSMPAQPARAAQPVTTLTQPQAQPVPATEQPGSALPASAPVVELLPPSELMPRPSDCSLWDVLQTTPNVTFFLQAVQAVGLTG